MTPRLARLFLLTFALAAIATVFTGCATTDEAENESARPWNTPKSWEHGIPGGMMQGR